MTYSYPAPSRAEAVAFLALRWPPSGNGQRHACHRALIGGLLRDRLTDDDAAAVVEALTDATADDDPKNRLSLIGSTRDRLKEKKPAEGWPKLAERLGEFGKDAVAGFRVRLGLTTTVEQLAEHKRLPVDFLRSLGLYDLDFGGVGIRYANANDDMMAIKERHALRAGDGSKWPHKRPLMAYGVERLIQAVRLAGYLILVEGESDCWTLWHHGFPALGIPGAETGEQTLLESHVKGVPAIFISQETDTAGEKFVAGIRSRLGALGWSGALKVVRAGGAKDASELHCQDPERFKERWQAALDAAEPTEPTGGAGKPKQAVRPPDPYRPFPVEALPEPIRSFVVQAAASIGCDPVYVALPALTVAASLIGNSRVIRLKRGWHEPSVLWSGIVGFSGTLKSPAFRAAVRPVYRLQRALVKKFKQDLKDYQTEKDAYDARKALAKKENRPFDEEEPEKPTIARVVTGDVTIEKLAQLLEDNPKGLLVARDELGGWLTSFTRYKGKAGGSDLQNWLELHQAGTIQYDRKTGDRPVVFVDHAAASVCGGIQPGVLAKLLTPEYMDAGMGARLSLMAMPPRRRKEWTEAEIDPLVKEAYETTLYQLRELQMDKGDDGEKEPFAVKLTPEAKAVWVRFYNEWAREQQAVEGELAAAYSKLEGAAARLALLHHTVSRVGVMEESQPVEPASIEAGVTLVRWFAYEVRRIYTALSETEDQKQTRGLIDLMRSWGGVAAVRKLQHASGARYGTAEDAEAALQKLVDAGLAEWRERPAGPKGGRPSRECVLKTDTTKTDKTPDDDDPDDDDFGEGVPTQPPDNTPPARGIPPVSGGCVGFVVVSENSEAGAGTPPAASDDGGVVSEPPHEVLSEPPTQERRDPEPQTEGRRNNSRTPDKTDTTPGRAVRQVGDGVFLVTDPAGVEMVRAALEESAVVGLDTETTSLSPRDGRVRLLSLSCDTVAPGVRCTYLIDCFRTDPSPLWDTLAGRPVVAHNAAFDLGFLAALGFTPGEVRDTMLLSQLLYGTRKGRGFHGLAQTAQRERGKTLDKAGQTSDWSGELTAQQLAYAALDADVLTPLHDSLQAKIEDAGLSRVAAVESACLPAVAWMGRGGVGFDRPAWDALAGEAKRTAEELAGRLAAEAPAGGTLFGANWDSPQQVKAVFASLGIALESTDDDALAAVNHPLAALLREYRSVGKLASTYGAKWYADALHDGRVYAAWRQIGADSGRMACSAPNLQNLPRDPRYRRCFVAPSGRLLVKADYSQIELRIAARITRDRAMVEAYAKNEDLHAQTARLILGVEKPTKEQRQLAKALNFGLLYGMGAKSLRVYALSNYGVTLTDAQAQEYRAAFFRAYPGLKTWHQSIGDGPKDTRTLANRRRAKVERFTEKLNSPVQGTGADGLKQALALLWDRRSECPGAFPVLAVHDEIVVEADADQADAVTAWLTKAMVDGMAPLIAPVPVEVETKVSRTWGGD